MNRGLKKAAVLGLSTCLALASLAGCSKKDEFDTGAAAITVNGDAVSAGLVKFMCHYTQAGTESFYNAYFGANAFNKAIDESGKTIGDMVKEGAVSQLKQMVLAEQKMGDYSVALTDEEKTAITAAAEEFMSANSEETLEQMGATQEVVERYLELCTIQNRMETAMGADVDTEVSDEEAAQRKIQYVLFTAQTEAETEEGTEASSEETEAQSEAETEAASSETEAVTEASTDGQSETAVLEENETTKTQSAAETETEAAQTEEAGTEASQTEEAGTEAQTEEGGTEASSEAETETETETETEDPAMAAAKEEAYAKAEEMIAKVKAGEEFDAAAQAIDPELSSHEMTFDADDTSVAEGLITATEGVADDTLIEEPIETSTGYYVVKLITQLDREATDEAKEKIVEERRQELVSDLYTEWEEAGEISQDDEVLAKIVFDFSLTPQTEAATEVGSEAATEAGSEAATEAGSEAVTEAETEAGSEAATEAGSEAAAETDSEAAETEAQTESITDAAAESESETEAPTEAATEK